MITPYFYPVIGGSQNYIVGLFSALRKIDHTIEVDVITYNTEKTTSEETVEGLHVFRVPAIELLSHQFAIPNYWSLARLIHDLKRNNSYSIVNSHTRFFDNSWWTPIAAKYLHAKSVLTDHCAAHPSHDNYIVRALAKLADHLAIRLIVPWYDQITVVSSATKDFLAAHGVKSPITIVSGAVDLNRFESKRSLPQSLSFLKTVKKNTAVISFIGRLIPAKGVIHFLEAARLLSKKNRSIEIVVAGDGELFPMISKMAQENIHIVGTLDKDGVTALLQRTDVIVHPSTHHEGLPLTILEAGAAGCAVLATPIGETKSLLSNGRGSFCLPTSQSIADEAGNLLVERKNAKLMGKKLRQHILNQYSWEQSAKIFQQQVVNSR
ncbi:glycosyltransferase family 4 protein [Candidatus Woesebacteria bacterium]|nr:glycosyltransferase family 4 protein [Candidatus Woesebacteria bacterium]